MSGRSYLASIAVAPVVTFQFFIAATGSDSNPGTLAQPWAITALSNPAKQALYSGKNVGIIGPATYDVSSLMTTDAGNPSRNPALNINGGNVISRTLIASCDASGNYLARAVTIDAKGASGFWGGRNDSTNAVIGCNSTVSNKFYWTLDGIRFTGFSLWCVHIGDSPSGGVPVHDFTVKNCEFYGGDGSHSTVAAGANLGPWIVYSGQNFSFDNNYCHDNIGYTAVDTIHFSCLYQWGLGSSPTSGGSYTRNTIVNSGNFQGKEPTQFDTEVAYNFFDMRGTAATGIYTAAPIFGFMCCEGFGTLTKIHHNVCLHRGSGISVENANPTVTYVRTACEIYNNTLIAVDTAAAATIFGGYVNTGSGGSAGHVKLYNNLVYDNGVSVVPYGYALTGIGLFGLAAYNLFGGWGSWNSVPNSASGSTPLTNYSTLAAWIAAIGGGTHPATSTSNPFTSGGTFAKQYQVQAGSPAYQTGRVGGTAGGSVCNIGAWDGSVSGIGADWV